MTQWQLRGLIIYTVDLAEVFIMAQRPFSTMLSGHRYGTY